MASTNHLMVNLDKKTRLIDQSLSPIKFKERSLRKSLRTLKSASKNISSYANEYNYKTIEANGFWSFIRLIDKLCDVIIESLSMNANRDYDPILDQVASLIVNYIPIVETLREATTVDANKNSYPRRSPDTSPGVSLEYGAGSPNRSPPASLLPLSPTQLITDADTMIVAFRQFLELEPNQRSLHMLGSFWLAPSMKKSQSIVTLLMALFARLPFSLMSLFDRSYRGNLITLCQHRATRDYPFAIWNLSELEVSKLVTRYFMNKDGKLSGLNVSNIFITRQSSYIVPSDGSRVKLNQLNADKILQRSQSWLSISYAERVAKYQEDKSKVKCLYIKPNSFSATKDDNAIILHAHGGGLIAQTPDSHLSYLTDWCNKLQTPILSVDYTTNNGLFVALQDVLDTYLWLASRSLDVELTLGYVPKRIILVGDSAGGSIHLTLCFVIADINKLMMYQEEDPDLISLPTGFLAIYTGFRTPGTSASRMLMSMIDPILSTGVILAANEQTEEEYADDANGICCNSAPPAQPSRISAFVSSMVPSFVSDTYGAISKDMAIIGKAVKGLRGVPWYRKSNFHIKKRMYEIQQMFNRSPYLVLSTKRHGAGVSDMNYPISDQQFNNCPAMANDMTVNCDFSSVQDINLHLLTTHFDPMLDDNVTLANLWQGNCQLTILNDLPHGFLNFTPTSDEAGKGSDTCVGIIKGFIK